VLALHLVALYSTIPAIAISGADRVEQFQAGG
jgi:hypothetical protein